MSAKQWELDGDRIMKDTENKLNSSGGFFSSFFSGGESSKKETAKEGYTEAANKYKLAKCWPKAANALGKAAKLMDELGDTVESGMAYANAGSFMFKEDQIEQGIKLLQCAVAVFQNAGKLDKAGKYEKLIGEKLEARLDVEDPKKMALAHYERAYDLFSSDETFRLHAITCLEKVCKILSQRGDYTVAIKRWDELIKMLAEDSRLGPRMKGAILNAFYCVFTQKDSVLTRTKITDWCDQSVQFARSRAQQFCESANEAFEEGDAQALATAFTKWERFNNMEPWQVKCIKTVFDELKPKKDDGNDKKPAVVVAPPPVIPSAATNTSSSGSNDSDKNPQSIPEILGDCDSDDDDDDESDVL
jgi:tetratricopeptide (TPR) repeat protein